MLVVVALFGAVVIWVVSAASGVSATPPVAASRAAAEDATTLLGKLALPPGATRVSREPAVGGQVLGRPVAAPATPNLVDRYEWWIVSGTPASVIAFIDSHRPPGGELSLTGSGTADPNGPSFQEIGYDWPPISGVLGLRQLAVAAVADSRGQTAVRVDAEDVWITPRPAAEQIPSGPVRLDVDVMRFGSIIQGPFAVTSQAKLRQVVVMLNALPVGQPGATACPADLGVVVNLTFWSRRAREPLAHAAIDPGGCGGVSVTIHGHPEPPLQSGPAPGLPHNVSAFEQLERILGMRLKNAAANRPPFHTFRGSGLQFAYPDSWRLRSDPQCSSTQVSLIAYLSNEAMRTPCLVHHTRRFFEISGRQPVPHLRPGSILLSWTSAGNPAWRLATAPGAPTRVGGRPAKVAVTRSSCGIGADRKIEFSIAVPRFTDSWYQLTACLRGPGLVDLKQQITDMLHTVRWR